MKLKEIIIKKYRHIKNQKIKIEKDITVLVGKNETGKTSILQAIAKSNYYDDTLEFNTDFDYPKNEIGDDKKSDKYVIECKYRLSDELVTQIIDSYGENVFDENEIKFSYQYDGTITYPNPKLDINQFIKNKFGNNINQSLIEKIAKCKNIGEFETIIEKIEVGDDLNNGFEELKNYFVKQDFDTFDFLTEHFFQKFINNRIPKFIYHEDYPEVPYEINLNSVVRKDTHYINKKEIIDALFNLGDIDPEDLLNIRTTEEYHIKLEEAEAKITNALRKYWKTNENLRIELLPRDTILTIRIIDFNGKILLKNASKGFRWFLSFLIFFESIINESNEYILLLDEPGLHLHPTAQNELKEFLSDLSEKVQIIYTTHSPFMIPDDYYKIRTVSKQNNNIRISESIQPDDESTLPLQGALGYTLSQNFFINKKNLIVEGISDVRYLNKMSKILKSANRRGIDENICMVATKGITKVPTLLSLMNSNNLICVCLLDTPNRIKVKNSIDKTIKEGIIKDENVKYFDDYIDNEKADIEDIFTKNDYLKLYNETFKENIELNDLKSNEPQILNKIKYFLKSNEKYFKKDSHDDVAKVFEDKEVDIEFFDNETLENFENIFIDINKLFGQMG